MYQDKPVLWISLERHIMPERDVNPVLCDALKLAVDRTPGTFGLEYLLSTRKHFSFVTRVIAE